MLLAFSIFLSSLSIAQKGGNVFKKGTDEYKIFMAKQDFYAGDYRSAVNKFKEVLKNRPDDASVMFFIGYSYFNMREYVAALEMLESAKKTNAAAHEELGLILGQTLHMRGRLDEAANELNAYKTALGSNTKKIEESRVDLYLTQINNAKKIMASPLNVDVKFLVDINSVQDDKKPVLSSDGKTMYFTSRRPQGDKSMVDKEGDYGFFDNVYQSIWDDEKGSWSLAEMVKGAINSSEGHSGCTGITSDGMTLFIYKSGDGAGDLYMSKKTSSGKWRVLETFDKPINSTYYEDEACITSDGNTLYFISERPGGLGHGDIWMSKKIGKEEWGEPVNLGDVVNTPYDENGLSISPDNKTLFFCSDGPGSMGSYDIFKSQLGADGKWSAPVNLGYPINTTNIESKFLLTPDGKAAYISSARDSGLGERDILMLDLQYYDVVTGKKTEPPKRAMVNGVVADSSGAPLAALVKVIDKTSGLELGMFQASADGSYHIDFEGNKTVLVQAFLEGYDPFSMEIRFAPGQTEKQPIVLRKNN